MPSDDVKLQVLNDHYKDTFTHIQTYLRQRDLFFVATIVILTIMLFLVAAPQSAEQLISRAIAKQLGSPYPIDMTFVSSVIWFLLLASLVRYLQYIVQIDRQYTYIHQLEDVISYYYNGTTFTREGRFYLAKYPLFSDWAQLLYRGIFPIVIVIITLTKIVSEWQHGVSIYFFFNAAMLLFLLVSLGLYLRLIRIVHRVRRLGALFRDRIFRRRRSVAASEE